MKIVSLMLITLCALVLSSCDKNTEPNIIENLDIGALRAKQLEINYQRIESLYEQLEDEAELFRLTVNALEVGLSTQNMNAARLEWKSLAELYKKCELYNIGDVNSSYISNRIYNWPINAKLLRDSLSGDAIIDDLYINRLGSHIIGLGAVEYILFQGSTKSVLDSLKADSHLLGYLTAATDDVSVQCSLINKKWKEYGQAFKKAIESKTTGGQNLLVNSLLFFLENTYIKRLGKPLGDQVGSPKNVLLLEAPYSDHSSSLLTSGFNEWKICFSGNLEENGTLMGFDDYLVSLGYSSILNKMNTQILICEEELTKLGSLNNDIMQREQVVIRLKSSIYQLASTLRTDFATAVGATIVPNDTDGD